LDERNSYSVPAKIQCRGWNDPILEPVFLDGNVDGATYLTLLQEDLMPAALFPNPLGPDLPDERRKDIINRIELHSIML
jgi:hypothetical protein